MLAALPLVLSLGRDYSEGYKKESAIPMEVNP